MQANPSGALNEATLIQVLVSPWRQARAALAEHGPVTLRFELIDDGDGLLDSMVLLDAIRLTGLSMEVAATSSPSVRDAGNPLECLGRGGIVQGAVADGVTPINFRFFGLDGPGDVVYSFVGASAPEDGGYDELGGDQRLQTITVRTQPGSQGWESVAQYLVPEEFNRGSDTGDGMRIVTMRVDFFPDDPEAQPASGQIPFQIWRPPVVLMHGLWSSRETWKNLPLRSDGRFIVRLGDYSTTAAAWFHVNRQQPFTPINDACVHLWDNLGVAMNQVDYIGHSMGGILGRNANALQPDLINKFFSMNTPHTGSPLGNVVVSFRNQLDGWPQWVQNWVHERLERIDKPIDQGALDDLSKGSSGIAAIPATQIPSHALVGIGGSDLVGDALAMVPGKLGILFKIMNFLDDNTDLFAGIQHDFVVGRMSQEGGIPASARTLFDGLHSTHFFTTGSAEYSSRIIDLLNAPATSSQFGHFPPPSTLDAQPPQPPKFLASEPDPVFQPEGIEIVSPMPGTVYEPGDTVVFSLAAKADFDPVRALLINEVEGVEIEQDLSSGSFDIPIDYLGPLTLSALAADADGRVALSGDVALTVATELALTDVEILQRFPVLVDWRDRRQLTVIGTFVDGVRRDISHPMTGTVYQSADTDIVYVREDGTMLPRGAGVTTVLVQNDDLQDSITVEVLDATHLFTDRFQ